MTFILNIETATQRCSIGLTRDGEIIAIRESDEKNIHAAKVTVFSDEVCREAGIEMDQLSAVAVSMGPGSYTGLRIGVSAAKGFCFALDIPLIAVSTLQSMALGAIETGGNEDVLYCPMIDARRMEVYTALYDRHNKQINDIEAMIVDEQSFEAELQDHTIKYFGDGAEKCREILDHKGMIYLENIKPSARNIAVIAHTKFLEGSFEDLAYFEPFYLKDFIAGKPKVKGLR